MTKKILEIPLKNTDIGDVTIGQYLGKLLLAVWEEGECFDGKRPFGNSGWQYEVYRGLVEKGIVNGSFDEDGDFEHVDDKAADKVISDLMKTTFNL
jgi:hypothetical protein